MNRSKKGQSVDPKVQRTSTLGERSEKSGRQNMSRANPSCPSIDLGT
jgi:hypothetical protein